MSRHLHLVAAQDEVVLNGEALAAQFKAEVVLGGGLFQALAVPLEWGRFWGLTLGSIPEVAQAHYVRWAARGFPDERVREAAALLVTAAELVGPPAAILVEFAADGRTRLLTRGAPAERAALLDSVLGDDRRLGLIVESLRTGSEG